MTLATLLAFSIALAIAAATPGPGMTAIVARALGSGFRRTMPMVIGLCIGDIVYFAAATFGLAALAQSFGAVFMVIKYLGAAYLAWLAFKLWTAKAEGEEVAAKASAESPLATVWAGLFLTLGNPKTMVFYLALLPSVIDLERMTATTFVELSIVAVVILMVIGGAYAAAAARARHLFADARARRILDRTAGTMMAGAAAAIAAR